LLRRRLLIIAPIIGTVTVFVMNAATGVRIVVVNTATGVGVVVSVVVATVGRSIAVGVVAIGTIVDARMSSASCRVTVVLVAVLIG
jgi:hypothetical protein